MSNCIFCKIVSREQEAHIIFEDDGVLGFLDRYPIRVGHTLVISKSHYETILDIPDEELAHLIQITKKLAGIIKQTLNAKGLRISNNNYPAANQQVPHIHFHIIPATAEAPFKVRFKRLQNTETELEGIADLLRKSLNSK